MTSLEDQYRDSSRLAVRMSLHRKYGRGGGAWAVLEDLELAPGSRVLEVGCGTGRFWLDAARRLPDTLSLTLTDQSPGMVAEALAAVRSAGRWRAVVGRTADVCALPFADASFDAVFAMHMLYHAPDIEKAVSEIARVLTGGGLLVVTTNGLANLRALFQLSSEAFAGPAVDPGAAKFSLESGEELLRRRFAHVEVKRALDELRITDPADVIAYLTSSPPGDRASPDELSRLRQATDAAFAAGGGVFSVTRDTGCLLARKAG